MTSESGPVSGSLTPDLSGRRVILAGARKGEEFTAPLQRRGIEVTVAAALSYVDLAEDQQLHAAIADVVSNRADFTVITTGVGWRGVLAAADGVGQLDAFLGAASASRVLTRGAKARGGAVGSGLQVEWSAASETSAELIEHLKTLDLQGKRIVVQHHGSGSDDIDDAVRSAGATPIDLIAYRTAPAPDPSAVTAAVTDVVAGEADVIAFTSAPLFEAYLSAADETGRRGEFVAALRDGRCQIAGFGELTAQPMLALGLRPLIPERSRLGALTKTIISYLEEQVS